MSNLIKLCLTCLLYSPYRILQVSKFKLRTTAPTGKLKYLTNYFNYWWKRDEIAEKAKLKERLTVDCAVSSPFAYKRLRILLSELVEMGARDFLFLTFTAFCCCLQCAHRSMFIFIIVVLRASLFGYFMH